MPLTASRSPVQTSEVKLRVLLCHGIGLFDINLQVWNLLYSSDYILLCPSLCADWRLPAAAPADRLGHNCTNRPITTQLLAVISRVRREWNIQKLH
ncbi:hypothetical protein PAAG_01259 [Paracoccidioides lutzii Pb01]|uniref:Uncharacterized protein n=1 Tax=Paracoccidioides lutzii (strain ATCC MYA-826 / Pb01) TaxID=502779 RepID=C1GRW4_PARBA|nr:hypothetical protein PAAG_01259 [Paracoccidioides lutzii Pb01]EEH38338.2 hypothetical protein PAAG_01259 [Paracoccidioides lutzii Pb01]